MFTILGCIAFEHNLWLVFLAAIVCVTGSWSVIRLLARASSTFGAQKWGWLFLASSAAGTSIWCTHFIAMLGYEPDVPIGFDPLLTAISLAIAIIGTSAGFVVATISSRPASHIAGGAIVGCSIAAMHYTGMLAYRVKGLIQWDYGFLVASVILCVLFSAAAVRIALGSQSRSGRIAATGAMALAIVALHFTGMAAFKIIPMDIEGRFSTPDALLVMALAVAGVALVIVGAGLASYVIDDSVRAHSFEELKRMALNDSLTGLPNRSSFNEQMDREVAIADACREKFALICIDLDRFKEINDLQGHGAGDEVLLILARRMRNLLLEGEFIARLGGDEFAAIQRNRGQADLFDFISRLEKALFEPIQLGETKISSGASLGVAIYPDNANATSVLVNNADLAMYRAKRDPGRSTCFYEDAMDATAKARRTLAADLREALEMSQLEVHYQVQTSVSDGTIKGYEALVRWNHPERGYIPPSEFIPLAEETGLIRPLGEWVLQEACSKAVTWNPSYKVAVNLSAIQLAQENLPDIVLEILQKTGLSPAKLELELTETAIVAAKDRALHTLRRIKALGVTIALDDFGTGYSSLETLRAFPFDKIKLDRSFMTEIETDRQAKAIIRAILALGRSLEIPVLAEGIETDGQLSLLLDEGCDEAQGFLLGRPIPHAKLMETGQVSQQGALTRAPRKLIPDAEFARKSA